MKVVSNADSQKCPPRECPGYPPILEPNLSLREASFYLQRAPTRTVQISASPDDVELEMRYGYSARVKLACSLYYRTTDDSQIDDQDWTEAMDTSKPVVILCHGGNSWRNQMLLVHLAANLTEGLACHTLRFDFAGNGHSGGKWRSSNYDGEVHDLRRVIEFVRRKLKCRVACVLGHSKGALAALRFAKEEESEHDGGDQLLLDSHVPCFVSLSGPYMVPCTRDQIISKLFNDAQKDRFLKEGCIVPSKERGNREITMLDIDEKANLDMSTVSEIEKRSVLIIHGDSDEVVSMYDAYQYAAALPNNQLRVIKGADHNFNGLKHIKALTGIIAEFIKRHGVCDYSNQNWQWNLQGNTGSTSNETN